MSSLTVTLIVIYIHTYVKLAICVTVSPIWLLRMYSNYSTAQRQCGTGWFSELKQISKFILQIHYWDPDPESFSIVPNYFKQL